MEVSCRLTSAAAAGPSQPHSYRAPPRSGRLLCELRRPKSLQHSGRTEGKLARGRLITVEAKREPEQGPRFERTSDKSVRFSYRDAEVKVPDQTLFLSGLALLGFGALIGPVVIGIAVTVVSISVAVSMGAFAISTLFFPLIIMSMLTFGFFSSLALLGVGVFAPKLIGLAAAGGGAAVVAFGLSRLMQTKTPKDRQSPTEAAKSPVIEVDPEEEEAKRLSQELRDFDVMLADREFAKRINQRKG